MVVIFVLLLTFLMHFFGSAVLSARLVGVRTGKMAASYSIYNLVFLAIRFLNTFQAPLLAKTVEKSILNGESPDNWLFFNLCMASFLGSIFGGIFIPTIQRFMYEAVEKVYRNNSILKLLIQSFSFKTITRFKSAVALPGYANINRLNRINDLPKGVILMNVIVAAVSTISVIACLYAGYLNPDLRTTCLSLSGVILGFSTVVAMIVVEPHISIIADKVIEGLYSEVYFRRYLIWVVLARAIGTGLSFLLLMPMAHLVVFIAKLIYV